MRLVIFLWAVSCWAQETGLLAVKRVYVERLEGGAQADQLRDMIIASLHRAGVFAITEDSEKADAVLRGSADDMVFTDVFDTNEGITARASAGMGTRGTGTTRQGGARSAVSIGDRDSARIQERKHEAAASVRLVNREGDVMWSTTQESLGAKFRSSSADVAERITRQLVADIDKLRKAGLTGTSGKTADANALAR